MLKMEFKFEESVTNSRLFISIKVRTILRKSQAIFCNLRQFSVISEKVRKIEVQEQGRRKNPVVGGVGLNLPEFT